MGLLDIFGLKGGASDEDKEQLGKLHAKLSDMLQNHSEDEVKWIAAYAGLLGKVANADTSLDKKELGVIQELLGRHVELEAEQVRDILSLFEEHRVRLLSIEDYIYIRLANETADRKRKLELIRALFCVAAADGVISGGEENEIRRVTQGLGLSHRDYIEARLEFKEHLSIHRGD